MVGLAGSTTATSGVIKLQEYYDISLIFDFVGVFTIFCSLFLMCGLKDIVAKKTGSENKKVQFKLALNQLCSRLKSEKAITVSMVCNAAATMTLIAMY